MSAKGQAAWLKLATLNISGGYYLVYVLTENISAKALYAVPCCALEWCIPAARKRQ